MVRAIGLFALLVALVAGTGGCRGGEPSAPPTAAPPPTQATGGGGQMELTSTAFSDNERMPVIHTADGQDISPPLRWSSPPEGTVSLALVMDDPDAPRGVWTHWLLWNLPPQTTELPENVPRDPTLAALGGARQGQGDSRKTGYHGPSPPPGAPHHYNFRIYALDIMLDLQPGATKAELMAAMEGHILAQGSLVGVYGR